MSPTPNRRRATLLPALFAAPVLLLPAYAEAQQTTTRDGTTTRQPAPQPTSDAESQNRRTDFTLVELSNEPFRIESVGLSMYLPLGSLAQTTRIGDQATVRVTPPTDLGRPPEWIINIQVVRLNAPDQSTKWVADRIIDQLRASTGRLAVDIERDGEALRVRNRDAAVRSTASRLIARDPAVRIGDETADRFYLAIPDLSGRPVIYGHTVFHAAGDRFITFELVCAEEFLPKVKPVYETTVATATFVDPTEAAARRVAAIKAGELLFASLSPSDFEAIVDGSAFGAEPGGRYERWERLVTPGGTGREADDTEHGYKRIQTWVGARGEMEPERSRARWTPADKQRGYLLRMQTRLIQPSPAGDQIVDSEAVFFMSDDRQAEAWTIRMGIKDPAGSEAIWRETGARDGNSMTIAVEEPGAAPRAIKPTIRGDGYISRLEAFLLPQLIVRSGIVTDYGVYAYQPSLQTIAFRTDSLVQPASMPGLYRLTTRLAEDLEPQTSIYTAEGVLRATNLPEGQVWQPVTLQRLYKIWQDKGLPLE